MKKFILTLISALLLASNTLFATSLSLLSLEDATMDQLVLMSTVRMLSTEGSKTELKNRLLKYMSEVEGVATLDVEDTQASSITDDNKDDSIVSNPYILNIISAQTLTKTGDKNPLIILEGSAEITFQKDKKDEPQKLCASKIVVDLANKRLSALGSVSFESKSGSKNESFQNIEGEIVSLDWNTNAIAVAGGSISTTRENSDGDSVTFIANSKELSYNGDLDSFILKDGYVTSSSDTAYSSITADKLALLPNGDMFLKNAYISIGRVPVLWFPYFYSPGATMVGNPSIGYESSRGLFVNTSFEIFGKYPSFDSVDRSSFSTLLSSGSEGELYPTSSIYTSTDDLSDMELWAKEHDNYLTLMFDGYQKTPYRSESTSVDTSYDNDDTQAFALGYATEINLFSDKLKIESATMASLTSDGIDGDVEYSSDFPVFRYDGEFNLKYDSDYVDLELNLPYSSDPKAKKAYSNRLSTFSLDALWNYDQTFPTTYTSDVSSYDWNLNCNISVPTEIFGDYVEAFEITSLDATATNTWKKVGDSYSYNITSYTVPSIQAKLSGQIFNFNLDDEVVEKEDEKSKEGDLPYLFSKQGFDTLNYENLDVDEVFNYLDKVEDEKEQLRIIEEEKSKVFEIGEIDKLLIKEDSSSSKKGSYLSLDYSIAEDYYNKIDDITFDDAGDYESSTDTTKNESDFDLNLLLDIKPSILKVNSGFSYTYLYKSSTETTNKVTMKSNNTVTLPFIGLSYYFNTKLYNYSDSTESGVTTTNESFELNDDWVTKHSLSLSKEFDIDEVSLTPSLSLQLPPLDLTLSPSLQVKGFGFTNNLSADLDIDGDFELDSITDTLKYSKDNFSSSLKTYYDFEDYDDGDRALDPLQLSGSASYDNDDTNQSLTQSFSYYGEYDEIEDYFDEIKTTYSNEYITSVLNFSTDVDDDNSIGLDYFKNTLELSNIQKIWWKNRAGYQVDTSAVFNWDFRDNYSTYFQLETSLSFEIAEFLTCDFSLTTSNHGFYNYYDGDGDFDFSEMLLDIGNAFDVFGDGRSNTNFNLEDFSLEFIHYMEDWDLHCKYTGTVVLSSYEYSWVPTVTFYLQWKTIPELKIDESFTQTDDVWSISE